MEACCMLPGSMHMYEDVCVLCAVFTQNLKTKHQE